MCASVSLYVLSLCVLTKIQRILTEEELKTMKDFELFKEQDVRISRMLMNPSAKDKDQIIKELNQYNILISSVAEELDMRLDLPIDCAKAFYLYGRPKFLEVRFDIPKIQSTYSWDKEELSMFKHMRITCLQLWNEFKKCYIEYRLMVPNEKSVSLPSVPDDESHDDSSDSDKR